MSKNLRYLSVHDASPRFQAELEIIFREYGNIEADHKWIAIVPNWEGKWDIRKHPSFLKLIKEQESKGWTLLLHGNTHSDPKYKPFYVRFFRNKNLCFEFFKLNYSESKLLAQIGMKIFEDAFGYLPKGFVPPNWTLSKEGKRAIADLGFEFYFTFNKICWFDGRKKTAWTNEMQFRSDFLYFTSKKILGLLSRGNSLVLHPMRRGQSILTELTG